MAGLHKSYRYLAVRGECLSLYVFFFFSFPYSQENASNLENHTPQEVPLNSHGSAKQHRKLSILFIGTQMATGGAQKVLLDQASWFYSHGYQVGVAFLYDRDGLKKRWQKEYPFPIYDLKAFDKKVGILKQSFSLLQGVKRLWRLFREDQFDAVETFTLDSNLLVLPLAWLAGISVRIATHHGYAKTDSWLKRAVHSWMINRGGADVLIAVTENIRSQSISEGVKSERVTTIPNGIQVPSIPEKRTQLLRAALNIPEGAVLVLSAGRLVYEKAYEVLIQSIKLVRSEGTVVFLAIAGEGELRDKLQELIDELALRGSVCLLGNREDVPALMSDADLFVMSSRSEGMPMALLEAMSFGLPVIATRVGGVEEVIEDSSQGMLVPPENPQELAKAILKLVRDPVLRSRIGKNARERIEERYTTERMCRQYEKVIIDLHRKKS